MKLELNRPLVSFDLETTGTDVSKDRICQLAIIKLWPDGKAECKEILVNPGIEIPAGATEVHKITNEMVEYCPSFAQYAEKVHNYINGCDLLTFNGNNYDIPLLYEEFSRSGITWNLTGINCIDACVIFKRMEERTLSAALKFYCGEELPDAHNAAADTAATLAVFAQQLERYEELGKMTIEELDEYSRYEKSKVDLAGKIVLNNDGVPVMTFGKYKDVPVKEAFKIDPGYYKWIMGGDFHSHTKFVLTELFNQAKN